MVDAAAVSVIPERNGIGQHPQSAASHEQLSHVPGRIRPSGSGGHCLARLCSSAAFGLSDEHFVCTHADGRMMQPTWITHEWVRLIRGTHLPAYRFHDLRHAQRICWPRGLIRRSPRKRLGHSKIGITLDLYSHVMPGMQEDAAARVDAALQAAKNSKN